jgi:hypothetical protein
MANYIIVTSTGRKLNLPVKLEDVNSEEIVATNAPYGMLFVVNKVLKSYFEIEKEELNQGSLVCIHLIEDFKEDEKKRLIKQIEKLDKV